MTKLERFELDDESAAIVAEALETGQFQAAHQVVREALLTWKASEDRLRQAIEVGAQSGPGIAAETVFSELEARYRGMMRSQV